MDITKNFKIPRGLKYLLISIPFVVLTFMFAYVPLFGWILSLTDFKPGMTLTHLHFVGFINFVKLYNQRNDIVRVLRNTLAMSGLGLLTSPLPIVFAILLNELQFIKLKKFIQTITTLPNFISWIVIFGFAFSLFSNNGLINSVLNGLGLYRSPTGIIGDVNHVWMFQLCLQLWKTLGWSSIIYLAAITGIETELYEAARVDGANKFRCIWHITLPGIIPTFFVLFILGISNILNNGFDQYFIFYNPLVANKIEVLDYYVYKVGLLIGDYPFSIAIGITKSLISIALLFAANFVSKKVRGQSIF